MTPKPRPAAFYPLIILTPLAGVCEILLIIGAATGRFSWAFAIVWLALLSLHVLNLARMISRAR